MAFTTERKGIRKTSINIARKGSIVKERCRQLAEIALELSTDRRIGEGDLAYLVERYIGSDKETVRAYVGYYGAIKHRSSGEGYAVGLSRKGYLEKFDFMHRARRVWVIHAQVRLPIAPIPYQNSDEVVCSESKEQISISFSQGERARENRFEKVVSLNVLGGGGWRKWG
ncbi:hypothetical protein MUP01_02420 [Candidatus Bathyarchaeota archaeon]|nr:hypothetical protein [Candidatus Bathyarchaeota archaeon]